MTPTAQQMAADIQSRLQQTNVYNTAARLNVFVSSFLVDTEEDALLIENAYLKATAGCELSADERHMLAWSCEQIKVAWR